MHSFRFLSPVVGCLPLLVSCSQADRTGSLDPSQTLSSVILTPDSVSLDSSSTQQFSAVTTMADGSSGQVVVTYRGTGGTITASGLFQAGLMPGSYLVVASATAGGRSVADSSVVTIAAPPTALAVARLTVSPDTARLSPGVVQAFHATGVRSDGTTQPAEVKWTATGGIILQNGQYTAGTTPGTYSVIASLPSRPVSDTAVVIILLPLPPPPVLRSVHLQPDSIALMSGATQQFTTTGLYSDGSSGPVSVSYMPTGGTISAAGLYTAGTTAGVFRVIAQVTAGTLADTSLVRISVAPPPPPTLVSIELTPNTATVSAGATAQFAVVGRRSDGSTGPVSVAYTATGGSINAAGLFTAGNLAGNFKVVANLASGSLADTSLVTVTVPPPTLVSIDLTPNSVALQAGATQQFSVIGKRSDGSTGSVNVTFSATGGTISSTGAYTAGSAAGSFSVIAKQVGGLLADTSLVIVTVPPPTLVSIDLTPNAVSIAAGASQQFSVVGKLSDGTTQAVSVNYVATGGTIGSGGLYIVGVSSGSFTVIATLVGGSLADTAQVAVTTTPGPGFGLNADLQGRSVYPANNSWNTPIDTAQVDPSSAAIIAAIGLAKSLHPDFGANYNGGPFGIPYVVVPGSQSKFPVSFQYASESDAGPYPIPPNPPIEPGSDRHLLMIDGDNWKLYELFALNSSAGLWDAGSGAIWDLASNSLRPAGWTSADAAGLPILPGLVRYDEVVTHGAINHALRFTVSISREAYVYPARHWASSNTSVTRPPMGMRVRLKASFDITPYPPHVQVILRALKTYGMMVADNGSDWFLSGTADARWDDNEMNTLKQLKGSDFEVVQMGTIVHP